MGWASLVFGVIGTGLNIVGSIFGSNANEQQKLAALAEQKERNARNIKIVSAVAVVMVIVLLVLVIRKRS